MVGFFYAKYFNFLRSFLICTFIASWIRYLLPPSY